MSGGHGLYPPYLIERPAMAFKHDFRPPDYDIPADHRPLGSINAALHELPVTREHLAGIETKILLLPRLGIVGVVIEHRSGGAPFRVIQPNPDLPAYPVSCALWVSDAELYRAVDMNVVPWTTEHSIDYGVTTAHDVENYPREASWCASRAAAMETLRDAEPGTYAPLLMTRTSYTGGVVSIEMLPETWLERP